MFMEHKQLEKASRILKGHRHPVPDLSVTQARKPVKPIPAPELSSDEKLIQDLSVVCNELAEQVLFSAEPGTVSQFQQSSSLLLGPEGLEDSELVNESMMSNVEISPSLLEFSVKLNKNVNHHMEEIKRLKQRKSSLLNEHTNGDPSVQAERYYAAQNLLSVYAPDNINKWSQSFPHGSGSENAQALIRQESNNPSSVLPVRTTVSHPNPTSEREFPLLERKQLVSAEAEAAGSLLQPKKPFLSSYRPGLKESDVPLLMKKNMK